MNQTSFNLNTQNAFSSSVTQGTQSRFFLRGIKEAKSQQVEVKNKEEEEEDSDRRIRVARSLARARASVHLSSFSILSLNVASLAPRWLQ